MLIDVEILLVVNMTKLSDKGSAKARETETTDSRLISNERVGGMKTNKVRLIFIGMHALSAIALLKLPDIGFSEFKMFPLIWLWIIAIILIFGLFTYSPDKNAKGNTKVISPIAAIEKISLWILPFAATFTGNSVLGGTLFVGLVLNKLKAW